MTTDPTPSRSEPEAAEFLYVAAVAVALVERGLVPTCLTIDATTAGHRATLQTDQLDQHRVGDRAPRWVSAAVAPAARLGIPESPPPKSRSPAAVHFAITTTPAPGVIADWLGRLPGPPRCASGPRDRDHAAVTTNQDRLVPAPQDVAPPREGRS